MKKTVMLLLLASPFVYCMHEESITPTPPSESSSHEAESFFPSLQDLRDFFTRFSCLSQSSESQNHGCFVSFGYQTVNNNNNDNDTSAEQAKNMVDVSKLNNDQKEIIRQLIAAMHDKHE